VALVLIIVDATPFELVDAVNHIFSDELVSRVQRARSLTSYKDRPSYSGSSVGLGGGSCPSLE
jgi:hypothetical protein